MNLPEMKSVESSNLSSVGYNEETSELFVQFKNGGIYMYKDVPANVHAELISAESVGKYFNAHVKSGFTYAKVT